MKGTETVLPPLDHVFDAPSALQIVVVSYWVINALIFIVGTPLLAFVLCLLFPFYALPAVLAYLIWAFVIEGDIHNKGGWGRNPSFSIGLRFSALPVWHHFRHYFRSHLVKTADLPADKNYIMAIHPHGVYCLGIFANVTGNRELFYNTFGKQLRIRIATLPGWREFMLSLGGIGVDRKSLERVLTESSESDPTKPAGNMVTLVIGGAEEFTLMRPKTMDLVLRKRKGFAKLALTTGASIVPVITFGENDTWKQSESKWMKKVNTVAKKLFHFVFPALEGRFGIMVIPFAAKLITVFGKPIHVEKTPNPTEEQIDSLHKRYMEELTELYETYKDDFFTDRDRDMCIVK